MTSDVGKTSTIYCIGSNLKTSERVLELPKDINTPMI